MAKYIIKAIKIMWKYERFTTILKFAEVIFFSAMTPLSLLFTQNLINEFAAYFNSKTGILSIVFWSVLLILSMFFVSVTGLVNNIQSINMKRHLDDRFTYHITEKYRKIEYACFEDKKIQDTLTRMGNSPQDLILNTFQDFTSVLTSAISIIGTIFIFAQVSWTLSLMFFLIIPMMVWLDYKAMKIMNDMFNSQTEDERWLSYYAGLLSEKNSLFELKIFSAVSYILNLWKIRNEKVLQERLKTTIVAQKYFAISSAIILTWMGSLIYLMIQGVINKSVSLGLFVSLVGSAGSLLSITEQLSYIFSNITRHCLQVQYYETFMNLPEFPVHNSSKELVKDAYEIEFDNVYFKYPNTANEVLKGITFKFNSYERLAIVGENGAGKSTIIKLLCKLYQPSAGSIKINGINLNDISESQLHKILCVVFQDYCCYNLSLRENVALAQIDKIANDSEIKRALIKGRVNIFFDNLDLPLGKIEDEGIDISGGEWQRLAISRALFSDSAFVILDEPTASIDPLAESEMYQSFANILENKGCIMISHRLASAKMMDEIIVIADGRVVESGKHENLLKRGKLYKKMWEAQSSWYMGAKK